MIYQYLINTKWLIIIQSYPEVTFQSIFNYQIIYKPAYIKTMAGEIIYEILVKIKNCRW